MGSLGGEMIFLQKKGLLFIVVTISLIIIFPRFAYAYLDPGTGSYILQVLIAAFFGTLFALKRYWHQVKSFFSKQLRHRSENKDD